MDAMRERLIEHGFSCKYACRRASIGDRKNCATSRTAVRHQRQMNDIRRRGPRTFDLDTRSLAACYAENGWLMNVVERALVHNLPWLLRYACRRSGLLSCWGMSAE